MVVGALAALEVEIFAGAGKFVEAFDRARQRV